MRRRSFAPLLFAALLAAVLPAARAIAGKKVKAPTMQDEEGIRRLVLPDDIAAALQQEFPGSRLPEEKDFDPEMLQYYHGRLIGVHPAVAWGDFNGDRKRDYLMLVITGDTKWGPLCELIAFNGLRKGYEVYHLGEVYNFKDDYVSFVDGKLYKGRFKKGGWYITWDPKKSTYDVIKD